MELIVGLISLLMLILWFVTVSRIGEIRDQAEQQTGLLRELVQAQRKQEAARAAPKPAKPDPTAQPDPSLASNIADPKVSRGVVIVVGLLVVAGLLVLVALKK